MPVKYICDLLERQYPEWAGMRYRQIDKLERFLNGTIYDHLNYSFYEETTGQGTYIPLRERRPSVIYNIPHIIVTRSTSLLFGGDHWPKFHSSDPNANKYLQTLNDQTGLRAAMLEAATIGSLGSSAVCFSVVNEQFFYDVWNPKYCTPVFDEERELEELLIMVPTRGYELKAQGYSISGEDEEELFFFAKRLTKEEEIRYIPVKCEDLDDPEDLVKDSKRSRTHDLGIVPGVWIKNLPSTNGIDGCCSFEKALNLCVEIDYQLSQCGRGLKYNSDPQMVINEPSGGQDISASMASGTGATVRSTSNTLYVGEEGDAKLLEISGQGQKAVLEFVKQLRQYALEVGRGSRKDPERAYGNMSGRAMEILDEDLISFAAVLRITWGDLGLKNILSKILKTSAKLDLVDQDFTKDKDFAIQFQWGNWFDPTPIDLFQTEQALDLSIRGRRIWPAEGRVIAAQLWGVGHADPQELEKEWAVPPKPPLVEDEEQALVQQKKAAPPVSAGGDDGRDAKRVN